MFVQCECPKGVLARPIAVDLFAGAGGLSLGLEQAGFHIGAVVEAAKGPAATHKKNFPYAPAISEDIAGVTGAQVRRVLAAGLSSTSTPWNGEILVCVGGPPCQGYSIAGQRRAGDKRNELIHQFRRVVTKTRSRYFVMENVPGLLLPEYEPGLRAFVSGFRADGYEVADPFLLESSKLGIPQSRRRVIIVGWRRGEQPVDTTYLQQLSFAPVSVREAIGDLSDVDEFRKLNDDVVVLSPRGEPRTSKYAEEMRSSVIGRGYKRQWDGRTLSGCAHTLHQKGVIGRFAMTSPGTVEPISRYRRLRPEGISPTIRAGTGPEHGSHTSPRPIHYDAPRVITVREAARLQSFPDWFQFAETKWHAWQEIGNAVPPMMARQIGMAVLRAAGVGGHECSDRSSEVRRAG